MARVAVAGVGGAARASVEAQIESKAAKIAGESQNDAIVALNILKALTNGLGRFPGPKHVLPTARSARFASGLGVLDFMKRTTFVGCDPSSLAALAPSAIRLAEAEGLDAHVLSLTLRLGVS